jgi:hypothetical protein
VLQIKLKRIHWIQTFDCCYSVIWLKKKRERKSCAKEKTQLYYSKREDKGNYVLLSQ